ncbi:MAG TPA: hypothetical protein VGE02_12040 [Gemmatimonadales bacterium]
MALTIDSRLPLSLLQAVRLIDTPTGEDVDEAYLAELRSKRLGLSDTVHAQIRRYSEAVRRNQRTSSEEATALARLIGRRPDAEEVFRAAGRELAAQAYETISPITRRTMRILPSLLARPMALRQARRLAVRYLNGTVVRMGSSVLLQVPATVTGEAGPRSTGCTLYEGVLKELMLLLVGSDGMVEHVRCAERGEGRCEWRAEWRRK